MLKIYKLIFLTILLASCSGRPTSSLRKPVDTVGFAHLSWQMDSVVARINRMPNIVTDSFAIPYDTLWFNNPKKQIDREQLGFICPHDDYSYAGPLYESVLKNLNSPLVILFGVAHKARLLGIENKLVLAHPQAWQEPYGTVQISALQEKLLALMDTSDFIISDSLMRMEHSLEAIIPFVQYHQRNVQIIPVLVPAMPAQRISELSARLAQAISMVSGELNLEWGKDYSFVISTDAVHYGDEGWNGSDFAVYGTDMAGYTKAIQHENRILDSCLTGPLTRTKAFCFYHETVQDSSFRNYKWTWCGRYSVPMGLAVMNDLSGMQGVSLKGIRVGYMTSIDHVRLRVEDLRMGLTAPAGMHHWVGYAGVIYVK